MKQIPLSEAKKIIDTREPKGVFYTLETLENGTYIGIDNRTGDAFTEEFKTLEKLKEWLAK